MSDGEYDAFISYSSKDRNEAYEICYVLEQNDLRCWIAPRDIDGGESYANEIMKAIRSTSIVVLVMSENSLESEYVLQEIENAADYSRPILPFRLDETMPGDKIGYHINAKHWIEGFPNPHDKFNVLIENVLKLCEKNTEKKITWTLDGFNPHDIINLKNDYPSIILLCTPFYWAAYLYMGIIGNVNLWKVMGLVYLIPSIVCFVLLFQIWGFLFLFYGQFKIFLAVFIIFWIMAIIQGYLIRDEFLTKKSISRLISSNKDMYAGLVEQYSDWR